MDKSKSFTNDGTKNCIHGINNKSILNETLFEIQRHGFFFDDFPPVPKEIESDQKKILLERVQNSIRQRIENFKKTN